MSKQKTEEQGPVRVEYKNSVFVVSLVGIILLRINHYGRKSCQIEANRAYKMANKFNTALKSAGWVKRGTCKFNAVTWQMGCGVEGACFEDSFIGLGFKFCPACGGEIVTEETK